MNIFNFYSPTEFVFGKGRAAEAVRRALCSVALRSMAELKC